MKIVTSWMEKGIEQGIERGIQQGIEQGEQKVVKILLKQRFPHTNKTIESRINGLSSEQIEKLVSIVFELQSVEDLIKWLNEQD